MLTKGRREVFTSAVLEMRKNDEFGTSRKFDFPIGVKDAPKRVLIDYFSETWQAMPPTQELATGLLRSFLHSLLEIYLCGSCIAFFICPARQPMSSLKVMETGSSSAVSGLGFDPEHNQRSVSHLIFQALSSNTSTRRISRFAY